MKKFSTYLLAAALALPAFGLAARNASAQDAAPRVECDGQGRGHDGHHGQGRGHEHGRGGGHQHGRGGGHQHGRGPGHGDPAEHVERRARMMTAILDLDARQQAEVRRILTAEAAERRTIAERETDHDARHQAMRALHERTQASLAAVMNPTQRATMQRVEAARAAEHERRGERGTEGSGPNR